MKVNAGRELTLKIRIKDSDAAEVIWKSMADDTGATLMSGCEVFAISNDDLFQKDDQFIGYLQYLDNSGALFDVMDFEEWQEQARGES